MEEHLPKLKEEFSLDCVIVNAENAAGGSGITPRIAEKFFRMGCDLLTMGDHVWDRSELFEYFEKQPAIIRPLNFPENVPGKGWSIIETADKIKVAVISLLGRVFVKHYSDCPFRSIKSILDSIREEADVILVDFHAEATSEKMAMGWFLDGKVSAVFGTHTHIQTADERILPDGTAYITDLGMTGPYDSVIGQVKEKIINRFVTGMPARFEVAKENPRVCGVVIDIDETTGVSRGITRIQRGQS